MCSHFQFIVLHWQVLEMHRSLSLVEIVTSLFSRRWFHLKIMRLGFRHGLGHENLIFEVRCLRVHRILLLILAQVVLLQEEPIVAGIGGWLGGHEATCVGRGLQEWLLRLWIRRHHFTLRFYPGLLLGQRSATVRAYSSLYLERFFKLFKAHLLERFRTQRTCSCFLPVGFS